jgi:hypothetical protein
VCAACRRLGKRVFSGTAALHVDMLALYYWVLARDPDFQADLARLDNAIGAEIRAAPLRQEPGPAEGLLRPLARFARRWHLPRRRGPTDLYLSLSAYNPVGASPPVLVTATAPPEAPPPTGLIATAPVPTVSYAPVEEAAEWVGRYADWAARAVRRSILDQAEQIQRQARALGFSDRPPLQSGPEDLQRQARRLYRAAVLGWEWEEIARVEKEELQRSPIDATEVRDSVRAWAQELDIPLPRRPGESP